MRRARRAARSIRRNGQWRSSAHMKFHWQNLQSWSRQRCWHASWTKDARVRGNEMEGRRKWSDTNSSLDGVFGRALLHIATQHRALVYRAPGVSRPSGCDPSRMNSYSGNEIPCFWSRSWASLTTSSGNRLAYLATRYSPVYSGIPFSTNSTNPLVSTLPRVHSISD